MTLIQFNTGSRSMEMCIREAYESFDVPPLGGASNDGWSKMYDFQRCPYRYKLIHETPVEESLIQIGEKAAALETGALWHAMLACHYMPGIRGSVEYPTPYMLARMAGKHGGNQDIIEKCIDMYGGYFNYYKNWQDEGMEPLAIEMSAGKEGVHTCRFDMLARWNGGIWNVEHKTASRESRDVLEGWWLDGEIIGQHYGYKLSGLESVYGPLTGTVVNIAIKTNVPKFRRVEVIVTDQLITDYIRDRAYWSTLRQTMQDSQYWPRKLQGCIGRYDTCTFWDHCRDAGSTDDARLNRMLQLSLEK